MATTSSSTERTILSVLSTGTVYIPRPSGSLASSPNSWSPKIATRPPDPSLYKKRLKDGTTAEDLDESYWCHLKEYEKTRLRKLFVEEMEQQCLE
ncbi:hypothetical protein K458DRAFT_412271 [Lentithecium fluviatile CBS 122367]|uniref:Uncharacterized protein n=1 Tax=Lentithecium fluviatile CBS 122367 TaxID=1168545 RepID=A0A6G1JKE2_9PLEO|nr:hypothetical protein K458DRAFT_412271 [Lentithecium fluviatile CBS 122367]